MRLSCTPARFVSTEAGKSRELPREGAREQVRDLSRRAGIYGTRPRAIRPLVCINRSGRERGALSVSSARGNLAGKQSKRTRAFAGGEIIAVSLLESARRDPTKFAAENSWQDCKGVQSSVRPLAAGELGHTVDLLMRKRDEKTINRHRICTEKR
jgi:hypothetical protein